MFLGRLPQDPYPILPPRLPLGCMQTAVECMRVAVVWAARILREKRMGAAGMGEGLHDGP